MQLCSLSKLDTSREGEEDESSGAENSRVWGILHAVCSDFGSKGKQMIMSLPDRNISIY